MEFFNKIIKYISDNRQWIFSGVGIPVLSYLFLLIVWLLKKLVSKINDKRKFIKMGIGGLWCARFTVHVKEETHDYQEIIKLSIEKGHVIGRIVDDVRNYDKLKPYAKGKPLRLKGEISDNQYFTGEWFHPIQTHRFHGAFQLIITPESDKMYGKWIGYSTTMNTIDSGEWTWTRIN